MFQSRSNNDAEKVFAGVYRRLYSEPAEAVCASRDQRGAPVTTGVGYSAGTDDPMAPAAPTDSVRAIQGLSPGRLALRRLLKDRVTMVAFFVAIFFVVLALVAPLLEAARRAGVPPGRCAYVGDDLRDMVAGRAAGMATLAAAWGYLGQGDPIEAWGADHVLSAPDQLLQWLELA